MKATHRCPRCACSRLLRIARVADVAAADSYIQMSTVRQIARARHPATKPAVVAIGVIEAYVCVACGLSELYTLEPDSIPIDGEQVCEL